MKNEPAPPGAGRRGDPISAHAPLLSTASRRPRGSLRVAARSTHAHSALISVRQRVRAVVDAVEEHRRGPREVCPVEGRAPQREPPTGRLALVALVDEVVKRLVKACERRFSSAGGAAAGDALRDAFENPDLADEAVDYHHSEEVATALHALGADEEDDRARPGDGEAWRQNHRPGAHESL